MAARKSRQKNDFSRGFTFDFPFDSTSRRQLILIFHSVLVGLIGKSATRICYNKQFYLAWLSAFSLDFRRRKSKRKSEKRRLSVRKAKRVGICFVTNKSFRGLERYRYICTYTYIWLYPKGWEMQYCFLFAARLFCYYYYLFLIGKPWPWPTMDRSQLPWAQCWLTIYNQVILIWNKG